MKPSVDRPQWNPASSENEVRNLVNQMRSHANAHFSNTFLLTTAATGVMTTVLSVTMPTNSVWTASHFITARGRTLGHASVWILQTFGRDAGAPASVGGAVMYSQHDMAMFIQFAINGNDIAWQVQDDGAQTVDWVVECSYQEIPRA